MSTSKDCLQSARGASSPEPSPTRASPADQLIVVSRGCLSTVRRRLGPQRFSGMDSRSVAESAAKYSGEMSVVAKAAVVGDRADRLAGVQRRPAMQKTRGVIQPDRIDEMRAGRAPRPRRRRCSTISRSRRITPCSHSRQLDCRRIWSAHLLTMIKSPTHRSGGLLREIDVRVPF